MRNYGKVKCAFWRDIDMRRASEDGRSLALYLLTTEMGNALGCFWLLEGHALADLQWGAQRLTTAEQELTRIGFLRRHEGWVFLPKFLEHNTIENANVALACVRVLQEMPKDFPFIDELVDRLAAYHSKFASHGLDRVLERFTSTPETVPERFANGSEYPSQSHNQNQKDSSSPSGDARSAASQFEDFWKAYPRKIGRKACFTKFGRIVRSGEATLEQMLAAIATYQANKPPDRDFCHPLTWLNQGRWLDQWADAPEVIEPPPGVDPVAWWAEHGGEDD